MIYYIFQREKYKVRELCYFIPWSKVKDVETDNIKLNFQYLEIKIYH